MIWKGGETCPFTPTWAPAPPSVRDMEEGQGAKLSTFCLATMDRVPDLTLVPAWSLSWRSLLSQWHLRFIKNPVPPPPGASQFSFCPASYTHSQPFSMAWIRGHLDRSVAFTFLLICSPLIWGSTELPPGTMDHCSGWAHLAHSPDTPNQGAVLTQRVPADSFSNL